MKGMIEAAGFVDVKEQVVKMPWSPWAVPHTEYYRIGQLLQKFIKTGMQGWLMAPLVKYKGVSGRWTQLWVALTRVKFTEEQVNELCNEIMQEIDANDQHWYFRS